MPDNATNSPAHTPTPWSLSGRYLIRGPKDESQPWQHENPPVARVRANQDYRSGDGEIDAANAAFIVRAVNSHAALLSALQGLIEAVALGKVGGWESAVMKKARAALAAATGSK